MLEKVYCKNCIYLMTSENNSQELFYDCSNPYNIVTQNNDTWYEHREPIESYSRKPNIINGFNDCEWYKE